MIRMGLYDVASWLLPGGKRVVPYSIQRLYRQRPEWYREDLLALFDLLQQRKIKPVIALRLPLIEARQAQELLGRGGVKGKIVLLCQSSGSEEK
jgi:NADPH:quinone reductase-like Zn-dependent oxidoreductase